MSLASSSPVLPAPPKLPLAQSALFLDFDGTLVEIASRPDGVVVPAELPALLDALRDSLDGALAVVSGRRIAELDRLLSPARFAAAGVHGAEWREPGSEAVRVVGEPLPDELRRRFQAAFERLQARWPGLLAEDKGSSLAVHYRLAPDAEAAVQAALDELTIEPRWQILGGHQVLEIKCSAVNKGIAVRDFMQGPAFTGHRPIYVGDDRTDTDGLAVAVELGGEGIVVGDLAAPAARFALTDPAAVRAWLKSLLE